MSPRLTRAYHSQIDRIHAAEDLRAANVAIVPNLKDPASRLREMTRRAQGHVETERIIRPGSNADLDRFFH